MEEVKAYIESGILGLYVLGELCQDERARVEEMALKYPAVKAELNAIERLMEDIAGKNSIQPPDGLRSRPLNSLLTNLADDRPFPEKKRPAINTPAPQVKINNFYKYAFADCLALLLVSVAALLNVYKKLQLSAEQVAVLSTQNQRFSKTVNYQTRQLDMLRDTAYKIVKLLGTQKNASSAMMVAWSPAKKKVMIDLAGMNMPANDAAHQYQLWAIVAGKPVNLGVFDVKADTTGMMKVMKPVAAPQTFAVTLEPRGGSASPHLENMVVIANI